MMLTEAIAGQKHRNDKPTIECAIEGKIALKKTRNLEEDGRIYEYTSAADPNMSAIPVLVHPPELHMSGLTRIIPFDLSSNLRVEYPATSPNLMASYIRIVQGESIDTQAVATSQVGSIVHYYSLLYYTILCML